MRRIAPPALFAVLVLLPPPAAACTFCAGGAANRSTLREHLALAPIVAFGALADARIDPDGRNGATDFTPSRVLKSPLPPGVRVTLPRYLPPVVGSPTGYLLFAAGTPAKPDPLHGLFATPAAVEYVAAIQKLPTGVTPRLAFAFGHLASPDPVIAADAFLEVAKASDAEVTAARGVLKPAVLRKLLADPATPADRHGVYALLLGLCATPADAAWLRDALAAKPPAPAVRDNLGGYLCGLTLADPTAGWPRIEAVLTDPARPFADRLSAIGAVRYFQATQPASRPAVVQCYRGLLPHADLADVAVDDLRRWGYYEATADVLALFDKPTHAGQLVRRQIVHYALASPSPEAAAFVARVRAADPKLVAAVEAWVRQAAPSP